MTSTTWEREADEEDEESEREKDKIEWVPNEEQRKKKCAAVLIGAFGYILFYSYYVE